MDWQIAGHRNQIKLLKKAFEAGKLAHAYVFAGPEAVGKRTVAKRLAKEMLGSGTGEEYFHPDFLEIAGADGIKIEQIRELTYKLSLKPYQAKYKVALIDSADQMTTEAANALLKVLEEPKAHTFMILITSNPNRLPKTVLSRSQKITFGTVAFSDYENLLPAKLDREKYRVIETLAAGKPGLALKIAANEDYLEEIASSEQYFEIFMGEKLAERLITAYEIANMETSEIKNLMDNWLLQLQHILHQTATKQVARKISQLAISRRFLEQNVNTKLLLTNLMLSTS